MPSSPVVPKTLGLCSIESNAGVTIETTRTEPLVSFRDVGPDAQPDAPEVGAWKK